MPSDVQVREAVAAYAAAVSAGDKAGIVACYNDDARVTDPYPQPTFEGREEVSKFWDGVFALGTPVSFVPGPLVVAGDRGVFSFAVQVEVGECESRVRLQVEGYDILTIDDDGLIADQLAYWDPASMHPVEACPFQ